MSLVRSSELRRFTDATSKLVNTCVNLRASSFGSESDFEFAIPSWCFQLHKGQIDTIRKTIDPTLTHNEVEAMILMNALEPALKILKSYHEMGVRGQIANVIVDWGCCTMLKYLAGFLIEHFPMVAFRLGRCRIHSWSNWISDSSNRAVRIVSKSPENSLTKVSELLFWECRALNANVGQLLEILKERGAKTEISSISESAAAQKMTETKRHFTRMLKFINDTFDWGQDSASDEESGSGHKRAFKTLQKRAEKFLWLPGQSPQRIIGGSEEQNSESEKWASEFIEVLNAAASFVFVGNLSRWMSLGPACASILIMRWCHPTAMQTLFKRCAKKGGEENVPLMHIGGGDFVKDGQVVGKETVEDYVCSLMTIMLMSGPGDLAVKASRRTKGRVKAMTNSEVDVVWRTQFDAAYQRRNRAVGYLATLWTQLGCVHSWKRCLAVRAGWTIGFMTMWGQYEVQQGDERISTFLPGLQAALSRAITDLNAGDAASVDRLRTEVENLHHAGGITREQELGNRSISWGVCEDVREAEENGGVLDVMESWSRSVGALMEHGWRDAYPVRTNLILFFYCEIDSLLRVFFLRH